MRPQVQPKCKLGGTEWPATDFSKHSVEFSEIRSGGPPKDGIPAIDAPRFEQLDAGRAGGWAKTIGDNEPVISLVIAGDARAYPVRILIWHEIVNDTVGGIPVVITYCPPCNSGLVFERALADRVLDFGTTGKLRNSDLVMYDRQTESWWQQFTGEAIVGTLSSRGLRLVPSRMELLLRFRQRFPGGKVRSRPTQMRAIMGQTLTSDTTRKGSGRFCMMDRCPRELIPMERVVAVESAPGRYEAWPLASLRREGRIAIGDLLLTWEPGQASALDARRIAEGRDVGTVVVQRQRNGENIDIPYDVTFAFAFHAFRPDSPIHGASRGDAPN